MGKVKVARKSTAVDMTAMCDVAFLLLTFFMLTSNFTAKEPVQVSTPSSVSEVKIPEVNVLKIIVDKDGKVFIGIDGQQKRKDWLDAVASVYKTELTKEQIHQFSLIPSFGVPMDKLQAYLSLPGEERDLKENQLGVPADSLDNQFKEWVKAARMVNPELTIAIKADRGTPYPKIKKVMNTLQEIRENRYNLITSLEEAPKDL